MNIQKLEHGKFLCKANFANFVECFNEMVDFINNLKGDFEVDGASGKIQIDKTEITHPIIRYVYDTSDLSGEGGNYQDKGCFRLEDDTLKCCYYNVGGMTKSMENTSISSMIPAEGTKLICLVLDDNNSATIEAIDETDLESEQEDYEQYVKPLYRFTDGEMTDDFRFAPQIQKFEG